MAELQPGGAVQSFAGTSIVGMTGVAAIGYPSITPRMVEAYVQTLGRTMPVDLLNGAVAPRTDVFTCQVLLRAADSSSTPWADVMAAFRTLQGLPETGTLVVKSDAASSGTVSCTARRQRFTLVLSKSNARHILVDATWTLLSEWA